ncbi:hypothetical protein GCM10010174_41730 [Kutzneria viridogrisea]|uniref:Uncharacterized protein n=2 Tax=Kutzneria TaxID=43356 RepID=W5W7H4_9PSEU|nr:hypothetical protein [Kutzneria albida]AHH94144.1 hypothetical protein KALB_770 [Kutzneria albida DSM 43870]MBA8929817.1 hypothetical protein [Kutzneria viridogrisea]
MTAPIPSLADARVVAAPALREAALVLDALAVLVGKRDKEVAARIRAVVTEVEAGQRIERPCCDNPWRATIESTLTED